jgi:hypothetical protein
MLLEVDKYDEKLRKLEMVMVMAMVTDAGNLMV